MREKEGNYKKIVPAAVLTMGLAASGGIKELHAQETQTNDGCKTTESADYVSAYATNGGVLLSGPSLQGDFLLSCSQGNEGEIWVNNPLGSKKGLTTTELDLDVRRRMDFGKVVIIPGVGFLTGITHDNLTGSNFHYDTVKPYIEADFPIKSAIGKFTLVSELGEDFFINQGGSNTLAHFGVRYTPPRKIFGAGLTLRDDEYKYYGNFPPISGREYGARLDWTINPDTTVSARVDHISPTTRVDDIRPITIFQIGITCSF